jgi:hypothetical protein
MSFSALVTSVTIMALRGDEALRFKPADRQKQRLATIFPLAVGLW